jgi:hypothetical protein
LLRAFPQPWSPIAAMPLEQRVNLSRLQYLDDKTAWPNQDELTATDMETWFVAYDALGKYQKEVRFWDTPVRDYQWSRNYLRMLQID